VFLDQRCKFRQSAIKSIDSFEESQMQVKKGSWRTGRGESKIPELISGSLKAFRPFCDVSIRLLRKWI